MGHDEAMELTTVVATVTSDALEESAVRAAVEHPAAGAVVSFVGAVRNHDHDRAVEYLEYEAHPDASAVLETVAQEILDAHPVYAVAVAHRVGRLEIGDAALVAAVSADHRGQAFAAAAALVDLVKERLPVWKHQYFTDGTDEWVNCA